MNLEQLLDTVPAYAKNLKLNLSNLLQQPELSGGTAVTSAITARNPRLLEAARAAAAIIGMNNVFYRFQHLAENKKYETIPARLRMNAIRSHGVEPVEFELFCIAASAINGCGVCIDSHEKVEREKGTGEEVILGCVRIAPVIYGLATVFDAEFSV